MLVAVLMAGTGSNEAVDFLDCALGHHMSKTLGQQCGGGVRGVELVERLLDCLNESGVCCGRELC